MFELPYFDFITILCTLCKNYKNKCLFLSVNINCKYTSNTIGYYYILFMVLYSILL